MKRKGAKSEKRIAREREERRSERERKGELRTRKDGAQ
jgi:hypothetical protein